MRICSGVRSGALWALTSADSAAKAVMHRGNKQDAKRKSIGCRILRHGENRHMSDGQKLDNLTKTVGQLAEQFTVFGTKLDRMDVALDVVAIQVAQTQTSLDEHRAEAALSFGRVDRRLGNIESRLEAVEIRTR